MKNSVIRPLVLVAACALALASSAGASSPVPFSGGLSGSVTTPAGDRWLP